MTQAPESSGPVGFLAEAEKAAQIAWAAAIAGDATDPTDGAMIVAALKHPFLRHLMELYLNNSVTSLGAKILLRLEFAEAHDVRARADWCRGLELAAVDLTPLGARHFEKLRSLWVGSSWFDLLEDGITDYACRDAGEGICLGREHLMTAIENRDIEILRRVVFPNSIDYQFDDLDEFAPFPEAARLVAEEFWSPHFSGRRAAQVLVPVGELDRSLWSAVDADAATGAGLRAFLGVQQKGRRDGSAH